MRVYLSGAIEHSDDGGTGWRRELSRLLEDELHHEVYDPAADEKKCLTEEERIGFRSWKHDDPARFRRTVRKIIAWDLDFVEKRTDYVVALWDRAAGQGGGTAAEITLAHRLGKPVYLLLGMPAAEASGWVLAAATEVFESMDALESCDRIVRGLRAAGAEIDVAPRGSRSSASVTSLARRGSSAHCVMRIAAWWNSTSTPSNTAARSAMTATMS